MPRVTIKANANKNSLNRKIAPHRQSNQKICFTSFIKIQDRKKCKTIQLDFRNFFDTYIYIYKPSLYRSREKYKNPFNLMESSETSEA